MISHKIYFPLVKTSAFHAEPPMNRGSVSPLRENLCISCRASFTTASPSFMMDARRKHRASCEQGLCVSGSLFSHTFPFCNLCHFGITEPCVAVDTGVGQVAIHTIDLGEVTAAAYRADIHLQFLMSAIVTVSQG